MLGEEEVCTFLPPLHFLGQHLLLWGPGGVEGKDLVPPAHLASGKKRLAQMLTFKAKHMQFLALGWVGRYMSHLTSSLGQEAKGEKRCRATHPVGLEAGGGQRTGPPQVGGSPRAAGAGALGRLQKPALRASPGRHPGVLTVSEGAEGTVQTSHTLSASSFSQLSPPQIPLPSGLQPLPANLSEPAASLSSSKHHFY